MVAPLFSSLSGIKIAFIIASPFITSLDHIISRVNSRVLGPAPKDFQNCAQRALKNKTPGVITIAHSEHKAAATLSAIRGGCVSTLIIDEDLADEIERLEPGIVS